MADANPSPTFPKGPFRAMPVPSQPPTQRDSTSGIDPAKIRRMNLNESPFPPSPKAIEAMQEAATRVNYYPDPRWRDLHRLEDVPDNLQQEILHFFQTYKDLERKFVEVRGWSGRDEAMRVLDEARARWPGHTEPEPWPR